MNTICMCGAGAGFPHYSECPYPLYGGSAEDVEEWKRAERRKAEHRVALFDVFGACYWYGAEYSTGQYSDAYRLNCTAGRRYSPGPTETAERWYTEAGERGRELFDRLVERGY